MHRLLCLFLLIPAVLLTSLPSASAQKGKADSPGARYKALEGEYNKAVEEFQQALRAARTPKERLEVQREKQPDLDKFAARFFALAEDAPKYVAAVDALLWVANFAPPAGKEGYRTAALDKLGTRYVDQERIGPLCTRLVKAPDAASETFLRRALNRSPHAGVQARAAMSLALNLKFQARTLQRFQDQPESVKQYEGVWGPDLVRRLRGRKAGELLKESEGLLEHVQEKHAKVKHPLHGTLGQMAATVLLTLQRPVAVGKVAPEIEGKDLAGKAMKLSDYRGQVVLLDFWGYGFPPSREGLAVERALLKRLAGKPFVVLGVNADSDRAKLAKAVEAEKVSWRSWWDGGNVGGPIATRWDVELWPTLFLIDHKGVVRNVNVGWPPQADVNEAVDALVREAEAAGK